VESRARGETVEVGGEGRRVGRSSNIHPDVGRVGDVDGIDSDTDSVE